MICIGYAGIENFDTILYTGRTLTKLKYRVLIVDISGTGAITRTLKHGLEIDSSEEIVNYRDINYIQRIPTNEELSIYSDDVVFLVYGNNYKSGLSLECQKIVVTVSPFPNIIDEISDLIEKIAENEESITLLIRDIITLDDIDRVKQNISIPLEERNLRYLYLDLDDYQNAVECQVTQIIRFTKISARMEKYIMGLVKDILPTEKVPQIKKAFKIAKKGG